MDTLYVVMPAYNEEANIEDCVLAWYPVLAGKGEASRLVVADSGSADRTHEILVKLKQTHPQLEILSHTGTYHGEKVLALYRHAIEKGADYVFQTDSDGQTNPAEFAAFWEMRGDYAGIFGRRNEREDGRFRAFAEKVVCLLLRVYFGVKVPDANAPFRLMDTRVLNKYLGKLPPHYNLPNIMLTTYFTYYGEKTSFRPIQFKPRQGGKNSVNIPKIVKIGWAALGDFRRFRREMK